MTNMRRAVAAFALSLGVLCAPAPSARAQDVFVYPTRNQTDEQMARDKEECHDWAVKQTGVDPVTMAAAQSSASGQQGGSGGGGAAGGAAMGAARGAMSGDAAAGAARGVGIGRLVHAIRARRQMEEQQEAQAKQQQQVQAQLQKYDRAFGACLTGRGYTVQ
jgi:hypothetical protein